MRRAQKPVRPRAHWSSTTRRRTESENAESNSAFGGASRVGSTGVPITARSCAKPVWRAFSHRSIEAVRHAESAWLAQRVRSLRAASGIAAGLLLPILETTVRPVHARSFRLKPILPAALITRSDSANCEAQDRWRRADKAGGAEVDVPRSSSVPPRFFAEVETLRHMHWRGLVDNDAGQVGFPSTSPRRGRGDPAPEISGRDALGRRRTDPARGEKE